MVCRLILSRGVMTAGALPKQASAGVTLLKTLVVVVLDEGVDPDLEVAMICSSLNLPRIIPSDSFHGPDSTQIWRETLGSDHFVTTAKHQSSQITTAHLC